LGLILLAAVAQCRMCLLRFFVCYFYFFAVHRPCGLTCPISEDDCGWSVENVGAWLESIGLGRYREAFAMKGVTGCELYSITHLSLKACAAVFPCFFFYCVSTKRVP
jgi:hypothetical protein